MKSMKIDGFEQFKNAANPPLQGALVRAGYGVYNGPEGGSLIEVAGRTAGGTALAMTNSWLSELFYWNARYLSVGAAIFLQARNAVLTLQFPSGAFCAVVWIDATSGLPYLNGTPGGSSPYLHNWYYFEVVLDRQSQTMALWINNRLEVSGVPLPAEGLSAEIMGVLYGTISPKFYGPQGPGGTAYYDDIYACYSETEQRVGSIVITTCFPTSEGVCEWQVSPAGGTHWQAVSSVPPEPLDKNVSTETIGINDRFFSNKALANSNPLVGIGLCVLARKAPALDARLAVYIPGKVAVLSVDINWKNFYWTFEPTTETLEDIGEFGIHLTELV
jgi:hypothetical protein